MNDDRPANILRGERDERYPLRIDSRHPIYVRPGYHPEPRGDERLSREAICEALERAWTALAAWSDGILTRPESRRLKRLQTAVLAAAALMLIAQVIRWAI